MVNHCAVFLDRDGVLMEDTSSPDHVDEVRLIDAGPQALRRLKDAGFKLFVVTNQSGVARGYFSRETVEQIHALLDRHFADAGVTLDRYYVCPHHPEDNCDCRKPKPKFLLEAAREFKLDLTRSYMVGDRATDVQCGINAGTRTILVLTGAGRDTLTKNEIKPNYVAADIGAATDWILGQQS